MAAGTIEIVADLTEIKPHSPEWHRLRQIGIGGSDAPTACGLNNRYGRTPYTLWAEKVAEVPKFEDPDTEPEYLKWGKLLEAPVREEFGRRTGLEITPFPRMVRNTELPFMLANVDGLTGPVNALSGVYEGKTSRNDWWNGTEVEVPIGYAVQGQHYLAVLGLDVVHYACLVGGQKLRIAEVARNDQLIEDLIAIEADFWQHVIDGTPPKVESGDKPMLSRRWVGDETIEVDISEAVADELRKRNRIQAQISTLEDARDAADALIMSALGEASVGRYRGDIAVTWKPYPATEVKAFTRKAGRRFLPKEVPA